MPHLFILYIVNMMMTYMCSAEELLQNWHSPSNWDMHLHIIQYINYYVRNTESQI